MNGSSRAGAWRLAIVAAALSSGCVTYREFPEEQLDHRAKRPDTAAVHYYTITDGTLAGGKEALYEALRKRSPHSRGQHAEQPPGKGVHVNVKIEPLLPTVPAIGAFYLSVSTLTLLPAWSTRDGYLVIFDVSRDGTPLGSYEYKTRRKVFLWIGMLPFIWVNAFTFSEEEVFTAIADQFFADAAAHFRGAAAETPR